MSQLESLKHCKVILKNGGHVVALNTGAAIDPEAEAMLQALHSRSTEGIEGHLEVLKERGAEKFMSTYYVGYGHKSIGDCGSATLFIEGVSMLAAKAIQDSKLYSGQESSTRYIDFANQVFINPLDTEEGEEILETWRQFYLEAVEEMKEVLKERYPKKPEENESIYEKAITARAFDTTRGFLPAGASTNLAWHGNLRQFADRLLWLRHHPLDEVKDIAKGVEEVLLEAYPNSFSDKKYQDTEEYAKKTMQSYYYHNDDSPKCKLVRNDIDKKQLQDYKDLLSTRPEKTELPKYIGSMGELAFAYQLDFGSFRDIQRHRAITQRMPLLTTKLGFNSWYLDELPKSLQEKTKEMLKRQEALVAKLKVDEANRQYYIPMGYNTSNYFAGDLPAILYMVELRATRFVHPTLRYQAQEMAKIIKKEFKDLNLAVHIDKEIDRFDIKRGEQDIVKK